MGAGPALATVLLIVKEAYFVDTSLVLSGLSGGGAGCILMCVDDTTGLGPAVPVAANCTPQDAPSSSVAVQASLRPFATCALTIPISAAT